MSEPAAAVVIEDEPPARSARRFIPDGSTPAGALTWTTGRERKHAMRWWRLAVSRYFASKSRPLRMAWALEWLFVREGYAYATDSYFERELELHITKVQLALAELEKSEAIVRASVFVSGKPQRRIWPAVKIITTIPANLVSMDGSKWEAEIPANLAGMDTRQVGSEPPAKLAGENIYKKDFASVQRSKLTDKDLARLDAERRERRERERSEPSR